MSSIQALIKLQSKPTYTGSDTMPSFDAKSVTIARVADLIGGKCSEVVMVDGTKLVFVEGSLHDPIKDASDSASFQFDTKLEKRRFELKLKVSDATKCNLDELTGLVRSKIGCDDLQIPVFGDIVTIKSEMVSCL